MEVATGMVAILLMGTGMILCLSLTFAVLRIAPSIRRNLDNMEETTHNLAEASRSLPETADNVKDISKNLLGGTRDISNATPILKWIGIANNVAEGVSGPVGEKGRSAAQTIMGWFRRE